MKTKSSLIGSLLMLCFSSNVISQNIEWGAANEAEGNNIKYSPVFADSKYLYTYAEKKKKNYFEAFEVNGMKRSYSTLFEDPKVGGKKSTFEGVTFIGGKYFYFYSFYDKSNDKFKLFYQTANGADGKMDGNHKELASMDSEKKKYFRGISLKRSQDQSKLFVHFNAYSKEKKRIEEKIILFSDKLEVLFEDKIPQDEDIPNSYLLDNEGTIYYSRVGSEGRFLIGSYDANKDYEQWESQAKFEAFDKEYSAKGYELPRTIWANSMSFDKDQNVIVTGLVRAPWYKNDKKKEKGKTKNHTVVGVCHIKLNGAIKEVVHAKASLFEDSFIDEFKAYKDVKKGREAFIAGNFVNNKVHMKNDGGIVVSGEEYVEVVSTRSGYYEYGSILITNFDKDGNVVWFNRIPKKQIYSYSYANGMYITSRGVSPVIFPEKTLRYFSYLAGIKDGKYIVSFTENPKDAVLKTDPVKPKSLKNPHKGIQIVYTTDLATGKETKYTLESNKKTGATMKPKISYQKEQGAEIFILGHRGKNMRWGKIKK